MWMTLSHSPKFKITGSKKQKITLIQMLSSAWSATRAIWRTGSIKKIYKVLVNRQASLLSMFLPKLEIQSMKCSHKFAKNWSRLRRWECLRQKESKIKNWKGRKVRGRKKRKYAAGNDFIFTNYQALSNILNLLGKNLFSIFIWWNAGFTVLYRFKDSLSSVGTIFSQARKRNSEI